MERVRRLEAEDAMHRWIVTDPGTQRFAPISQSEPGSPMLLSQVVRCVPANDIGVVGKVRVYLARWWEFLTDGPRETNTEGGIMPVIFGTVAMTLLLCVLVVPMGVVAALYLREYARQGWVVSAVRVAVNNLAGVPSIVYGVFGLGFFCYSVGSWVDRGPQAPLSPQSWWGIVGLTVVLAAASIVLGLVAKIRPLRPDSAIKMLGRFLSLLGWLGVIVGVGVLVVRLPYFHGFFRERPAATFGTPGVLWASLTLALLTLPVVIVSTEEAISAVPRSLREGSYGCGASKWQTIRRVVLPRAAPGIMTGMILAMARGAGEVAPLMLVGAVKLASELPFEASFPWLHLERSFMHLGFHIFDLGFQSPDSEGARPLVWTTTFILMSVVVTLNITAIGLRARLRRRFGGGHF
ncbi:MAG: phosphate ABC transporter permease PstA [Phycisphaerae bacterium]|nr:phosphate ABC transporter permease PstA [Phycisphaerae bacterium]